MKQRTLLGLVTTLLLAAGPANATTTYTTNDYSDTSTSDEVGKSCKEVSIASSTGVVSAKCNKETDGEVGTNDTTFDMTKATYCKEYNDGSGAGLVWGSGTTDWTASDWSADVASNGRHYGVYVKCKKSGMPDNDGGVAMSDTVKGLKNNAGSLEKRTAP